MIEEGIIGFVVWLFALILISFALERIWSSVFSGRSYQLILFPGVVIHELSHALGCLLSGAKVDEISFFSSKGSYVKHRKPKLPLIGNFIISFAPIIGGIVFLWVTARIFSLDLPQVETTLSFDLVRNLVRFTINNWKSWLFWLFVYLAVSIIICLVPSRQDLKNSIFSALVVLVAVVLIDRFNLIGFDKILLAGSEILAISVFFGLTAFALSLPVLLVKKLI